MWHKLAAVGGATIIGLGVVAAVGEPVMMTPISYAAEVKLVVDPNPNYPTALFMGGLGYEDVDPQLIAEVSGGRWAYLPVENRRGIPWPGQNAPFNGTLTLDESVQVGITNMMDSINNTPGVKIVGGASGSTLVVDEVMARLANSDIPKEELSFVVLGDANRGVFKQLQGVKLPIFDYTIPKIAVTKYDTLVVTGEYDGMGDWPDRSWNLLADLNAMAGTGLLQQIIDQQYVDQFKLDAWGSVHYDAMFADLSKVPAKNITVTTNKLGGVTTTYVVPTPDLPLLRPLKPLGVPQPVIDVLETVLRPIIDSAYIRNDLVPIGGSTKSVFDRPGRASSSAPVSSAALRTPVAAAAQTPTVAPVAATRVTAKRASLNPRSAN